MTQSLRIPLTADSNQVTNVVAAPDLTLTKLHSPDFVAGGDSTIRIVVSNVGNLPSDGSTDHRHRPAAGGVHVVRQPRRRGLGLLDQSAAR